MEKMMNTFEQALSKAVKLFEGVPGATLTKNEKEIRVYLHDGIQRFEYVKLNRGDACLVEDDDEHVTMAFYLCDGKYVLYKHRLKIETDSKFEFKFVRYLGYNVLEDKELNENRGENEE